MFWLIHIHDMRKAVHSSFLNIASYNRAYIFFVSQIEFLVFGEVLLYSATIFFATVSANWFNGFVDGSIPCHWLIFWSWMWWWYCWERCCDSDAYKVSKIHDKALMTLIIATLSPSAFSNIIGDHSSQEMWWWYC